MGLKRFLSAQTLDMVIPLFFDHIVVKLLEESDEEVDKFLETVGAGLQLSINRLRHQITATDEETKAWLLSAKAVEDDIRKLPSLQTFKKRTRDMLTG